MLHLLKREQKQTNVTNTRMCRKWDWICSESRALVENST